MVKESTTTIYTPENLDECTVLKYSKYFGCQKCTYLKDFCFECEVREQWERTEETRIQMLLHPIQTPDVIKFWR